MLSVIIVLLFFLALLGAVQVLQGANLMAAADDIKASQAAIATALATIAAQQASQISQADAAAILANENTNLAAAQALITP